MSRLRRMRSSHTASDSVAVQSHCPSLTHRITIRACPWGAAGEAATYSGGKPLRTAHVYYTVHTALCHCPAVYTRTVSLAAPGWEPGDGLRRAPRTSYHPPVAGQRGGGTAPVRRRTPRGPSESSRLCDSGGGAPWYRSLGAALYCVLGPQYTVLRGLVSEAGPFGRSGGRK